ncbi:MAG: LemA family protein [Bacilli bacterium]|nr:LemA family protein [Bacilli bacterium]
MANELDEMTAPVNEAGRDTHVIEKQLSPKTGAGSVIFEVILWVLGIIPGVIFLFVKMGATNYLSKLQQKVNHDASQIDNYLEQRVQILKNAAKLLDKSIKLDKDTFTDIAKLRSGNVNPDEARINEARAIEEVNRKINIAVENYPNIKAHQEIEDAMQQNAYLQKEITAAREAYNDTVLEWNGAIFAWPSKKIVAAKKGYTTRIPFSIDAATRQQARGDFF